MFIKQIYTNCLAHAAYYIESGDEAAVIDPLRNPEPYIQLAKGRGAKIKYVLETHFHADFVSGHIDLANRTGATIVFGPGAIPEYKAYIGEDGELLHLGDCVIKLLHTPGHTIESACFLLHDEHKKEYAVFTGDTLFVGDVGRPDLLSGNLKKEELAALMYYSLQDKIMPLANSVIVYPGHGAGSACGKNIGPESFSTIGHEKLLNYALRNHNKESFIAAVTADLPAIPGYFFTDAKINKSGCTPYETVLKNSLKPLSIEKFISAKEEGKVILDTRNPMDFSAGFIKGAINIGLNGDFAVWVGTYIPATASILLVAEPGKETEAVERLARIGYDKVHGFLGGGMQTWFTQNEPYDRIQTFGIAEMPALMETNEFFLLDVRNRSEVTKNRISGSVHIPLNQLPERYTELEMNNHWVIYCAGGYRSMIASSFLKTQGFHFLASVEGGITEIIRRMPELVETDAE